VTFGRNLLRPFSISPYVSDENDQGIGTEELVSYTGNPKVILAFQISNWPKFPHISFIVCSSLLFTSST
jgi:hypothetical protein